MMGDKQRDTSVMRRVAEGDEGAFSEFVDRWQRPVLSFVCRFLGCSGEEARDIAQEAFLRVWANAGSWKAKAGVSSWLFTIVANLCRNHLRTMSRRPALVAIDGEAEAPVAQSATCSEPDPEALAATAQIEATVCRALDELPENQRAALLLKQVEGLRYREIADVLGVSESAVESLLVRARRTLAQKISRRKTK